MLRNKKSNIIKIIFKTIIKKVTIKESIIINKTGINIVNIDSISNMDNILNNILIIIIDDWNDFYFYLLFWM